MQHPSQPGQVAFRPVALIRPIIRTRHTLPSFSLTLRTGAVLLVALALLLAGWPGGPPAASAAPAIPAYVYIVASGPTTYDLMYWDGARTRRLVTSAVTGTGVSDATARLSPDGTRIAYRITGDRYNGSSLRLYNIATRTAMTVTFSRTSNLGIGTFAWSPDSTHLAFTWTTPAPTTPDDGYGSIWMADANGKNLTRVLGEQLNDRLLAWSADSQGVYVERQEDVPNLDDPILHVLYKPIGGPLRVVLRSVAPGKKSPGLQADTFAVWNGGGAARIAGLAVGSLDLLPRAPVTPTTVPLTAAHVANRLPADPKPAAVVGADDANGFLPLFGDLARPDVLAWGGDGRHLFVAGGRPAAAYWVDVASGARVRLNDALARMQPIAWSGDGRYAVFSDAPGGPATTIVTADMVRGTLLASRKVGSLVAAGQPVTNLDLPYINQTWDTPGAVNGNWACGPTSVAMVLAYYGRLAAWPLPGRSTRAMATLGKTMTTALSSGQRYAQYITAPFAMNGRSFTQTSLDPSGHNVAGLYGTIVFADSLAHWGAMQDVFKLFNLKAVWIDPSWAGVTAALDKGEPVLLGTQLTSDGHILVARGYTKGGYLIVNDPYGNKFGPDGYGAYDGENIIYPWNKATVHQAMAVIGTVSTPPAAPPGATPTPAAATP